MNGTMPGIIIGATAIVIAAYIYKKQKKDRAIDRVTPRPSDIQADYELTFYTGIGQVKVSKSKREKGLKIVALQG